MAESKKIQYLRATFGDWEFSIGDLEIEESSIDNNKDHDQLIFRNLKEALKRTIDGFLGKLNYKIKEDEIENHQDDNYFVELRLPNCENIYTLLACNCINLNVPFVEQFEKFSSRIHNFESTDEEKKLTLNHLQCETPISGNSYKLKSISSEQKVYIMDKILELNHLNEFQIVTRFISSMIFDYKRSDDNEEKSECLNNLIVCLEEFPYSYPNITKFLQKFKDRGLKKDTSKGCYGLVSMNNKGRWYFNFPFKFPKDIIFTKMRSFINEEILNCDQAELKRMVITNQSIPRGYYGDDEFLEIKKYRKKLNKMDVIMQKQIHLIAGLKAYTQGKELPLQNGGDSDDAGADSDAGDGGGDDISDALQIQESPSPSPSKSPESYGTDQDNYAVDDKKKREEYNQNIVEYHEEGYHIQPFPQIKKITSDFNSERLKLEIKENKLSIKYEKLRRSTNIGKTLFWILEPIFWTLFSHANCTLRDEAIFLRTDKGSEYALDLDYFNFPIKNPADIMIHLLLDGKNIDKSKISKPFDKIQPKEILKYNGKEIDGVKMKESFTEEIKNFITLNKENEVLIANEYKVKAVIYNINKFNFKQTIKNIYGVFSMDVDRKYKHEKSENGSYGDVIIQSTNANSAVTEISSMCNLNSKSEKKFFESVINGINSHIVYSGIYYDLSNEKEENFANFKNLPYEKEEFVEYLANDNKISTSIFRIGKALKDMKYDVKLYFCADGVHLVATAPKQ